MEIDLTILEIIYLNEMELPRRKVDVDLITAKKLRKQEKIEPRFIAKFFKILEGYMPENQDLIAKFIGRYRHYVKREDTRPYFHKPGEYSISISEIFDFIRRLGINSEYTKVARTLGFLSPKSTKELTEEDKRRINTLKSALVNDFLDPIKRIMRGTASDDTYAGVSHPIDVKERFDAMRIKSIQKRWELRKLRRS